MNENVFLDGVSNIETDVVERFVSMDNKLQKKANTSKTKKMWIRVGAIAACLALFVGATIALPWLRSDNPPDIPLDNPPDIPPDNPPNIPLWENAQYSAEEIAALFALDAYDGVGTNAYTKVYVSDSRYLYIDDIPKDDYLNLYYNDKTVKKQLNKEEFQTFLDGVLPKLSESLDIDISEYSIEEEILSGGAKQLNVDARIDPYYVGISQQDNRYFVGLFKRGADKRIVLDGETVQIDQRRSDEEITASLQSIKEKLCEIFNVSCSDVKIIRKFDSYHQNGAYFVGIYFYNKDVHPLNKLSNTPIGDYIYISFDNAMDHTDDNVSDGILNSSTIYVSKSRIDISDAYAVTGTAKRISVEEAEALLYRGYVFGGHSCPKCMQAQDKVSFEGYDFVDMEYVFLRDSQTGKSTLGIPFYAFYKKIGTSKNDNSIYAKTYVAAIEVRGYDAYFESQIKNHKNKS